MENQKKEVWLRKALFLIVSLALFFPHDGANDYSKRSCKGIYDRRTDHWRQCSGERND